MLIVDVHYDNLGGGALEGGLKGQAVSIADLAIILLDLATFGASAASYRHWTTVCNTGLGFYVGYFQNLVHSCRFLQYCL